MGEWREDDQDTVRGRGSLLWMPCPWAGMQRDGQDQSTGDTQRGASRIREYNTYRICQSSGPSVIVVATCEDVVSLPKRRASFPMEYSRVRWWRPADEGISGSSSEYICT